SVLDSPAALKLAAVQYLDAPCMHVYDEGRHRFVGSAHAASGWDESGNASVVCHPRAWNARHQYRQTRDRAVRTPQLLAGHQEIAAVFAQHRFDGHTRRIRTHRRLGERERRNALTCYPRQVL